MAKRKGVSGKTHTKQQLNDYANQNNPNKQNNPGNIKFNKTHVRFPTSYKMCSDPGSKLPNSCKHGIESCTVVRG